MRDKFIRLMNRYGIFCPFDLSKYTVVFSNRIKISDDMKVYGKSLLILETFPDEMVVKNFSGKPAIILSGKILYVIEPENSVIDDNVVKAINTVVQKVKRVYGTVRVDTDESAVYVESYHIPDTRQPYHYFEMIVGLTEKIVYVTRTKNMVLLELVTRLFSECGYKMVYMLNPRIEFVV